MELKRPSISIIGSFKQHYDQIRNAWGVFTRAGIEVTSPKGAAILEEGVDFVRFESDSPDYDDYTVQSLALHRILRADLTYVVAPQGYVGRTTCYEIGRIIQTRHPIYFSEQPRDLPVFVPMSHVAGVEDLARNLGASDWRPTWLYEFGGTETTQFLKPPDKDPSLQEHLPAAPPSCVELEHGLIYGIYRPD